MSWARSALERNAAFEVVAADEQSRTFTVRMKDTGELRVVRADQLIAGVAAPTTGSASAKAAPPAAPPAPAAPPGAPPSRKKKTHPRTTATGPSCPPP